MSMCGDCIARCPCQTPFCSVSGIHRSPPQAQAAVLPPPPLPSPGACISCQTEQRHWDPANGSSQGGSGEAVWPRHFACTSVRAVKRCGAKAGAIGHCVMILSVCSMLVVFSPLESGERGSPGACLMSGTEGPTHAVRSFQHSPAPGGGWGPAAHANPFSLHCSVSQQNRRHTMCETNAK